MKPALAEARKVQALAETAGSVAALKAGQGRIEAKLEELLARLPAPATAVVVTTPKAAPKKEG